MITLAHQQPSSIPWQQPACRHAIYELVLIVTAPDQASLAENNHHAPDEIRSTQTIDDSQQVDNRQTDSVCERQLAESCDRDLADLSSLTYRACGEVMQEVKQQGHGSCPFTAPITSDT